MRVHLIKKQTIQNYFGTHAEYDALCDQGG